MSKNKTKGKGEKMAEEWVCEDCGHTSPIDPAGQGCPECGSKMVKLDEYDKDLAGTDYNKEDMETPLEEESPLELDDEAEPKTQDKTAGSTDDKIE